MRGCCWMRGFVGLLCLTFLLTNKLGHSHMHKGTGTGMHTEQERQVTGPVVTDGEKETHEGKKWWWWGVTSE